jgi:hypothetical protein
MSGQGQQKPTGFSNKKSEATAVPQDGTALNAASALEKLEAAKIKVIHGATDGEFGLAGAKVSTVRFSLVDAFNIPGDAQSFVNGEQVDANYVLQSNDVLEFVKQAGVKG